MEGSSSKPALGGSWGLGGQEGGDAAESGGARGRRGAQLPPHPPGKTRRGPTGWGARAPPRNERQGDGDIEAGGVSASGGDGVLDEDDSVEFEVGVARSMGPAEGRRSTGNPLIAVAEGLVVGGGWEGSGSAREVGCSEDELRVEVDWLIVVER